MASKTPTPATSLPSGASAASSSSSLTPSAKTSTTSLIKSKTYDVPAGWVPSPFDMDFVVERVDKDVQATIQSKLSMLYGTSVTMVVGAFLDSLFECRKAQDPSPILSDMVFGVFVSQTVSREWAKYYNGISNKSLFKRFEIESQREADSKNAASSWVTSSRMNATAVGILGHLILETVPRESSLGKKRAITGTFFNPANPAEHPNSEYVEICNATNKSLTRADTEALNIFKTYAGNLCEVVAFLLQTDVSSLDEVTKALAILDVKNF